VIAMPTEPIDEKAVFNIARRIDSREARGDYLRQVCGASSEVLARVRALLEAHDQGQSFLESPAVAAPFAPTTTEPRILPETGTLIGPYKLLQQIGEGGMGTVYMAEQTEPVQRKVALKLIKPGMDSRQVISRFEAERQALALMDHPNIAKVLDAGTTGEVRNSEFGIRNKEDAAPPIPHSAFRTPHSPGLPYFVMELVKGTPVTKYCDEHHLTPRERLELFIPVCQAVQHAHQKGIIHRDLKPSNVLVALYDGRPVPKVIDFGVAKATGQKLTERTMYTEFGAIVGTLEYMSPEQAESNQLDIDTRSDIYSLGVLLYELLTGTTPFEKKRLKDAALMEILRIIREDEPQKPSTRLSTTDELPSISANRGLEPNKLSALVRGELDWIVMKALEKDRNRRYETANGFAVDIQRYLADEPVAACPPSAAYRLRKFARRNKGGLVTAALVTGALVAGTTVSTWQAIRATNALESDRKSRAALDQERTQVNGKIGDKLLEVSALRERARAAGPTDGTLWADLLDTSRRAETLTSSELADPALVERVRGLLEQVRQEEKNWQMAVRLRELRLDNLAIPPGTPIPRNVATVLADAFRKYNLPVIDLPVAEAADRVRDSGLREELLTGLDIWSIWDVQNGGAAWKHLFAVAQAADDHPWRRECRDTVLRGDFTAMTKLACRDESPRQPAEAILLLAAFLVGAPRPQGPAATDDERTAANTLLEKAVVWHSVDSRIGVARSVWFPDDCDNSAIARETIERLKDERASPENLASAYFRLGLVEMQNNDSPAVITACREAIRLMPDRADYRAMLLQHLRNEEDRIVECTFWIQSGPVSPLPYRERANVYFRRMRFRESLADATQWTELSPQDEEAWYLLALAHASLSEFDEALAGYTKAIELATHAGRNPAWYWHGRSCTYQMMQDWDKAIADSTRAVELDPKHGVYWRNRGDSYREKGELQKAMADYDMAVENPVPNNIGIGLDRRAQLNEQLGRWDVAIRDWTELLKVSPHSLPLARDAIERLKHDRASPEPLASAYFLVGQAEMKNNDRRAAVAACRQAIRLAPDRADYREALIEYLGNHDDIIAESTSWIQSGLSSPVPYRWRANLYYQRQQYRESLADATKWTELSPQDGEAWYRRALAHASLSEYDEALAAYTKAIELATHAGQTPAMYWHGRSCTYQMMRDWDKAIADETRAVELDPKHSVYWAFRGDAYRSKGDLQKAMADYDMAVENPIPSNPGIGLQRRAALNKQLGQWEAVIRDLEQYLKVYPKNTDMRYAASDLFEILIEPPDTALRDPRRAIELDDEYGPLFPWAPDKHRRLLQKAKELIDAEEEP
jgi:serine/threonine protein kinase/tetratricopeptide (TPR) repeat protein